MSLLHVLPLLLVAPAQAPKWAPYAAKGDGFTVLLPAKPTMTPLNSSAEGITAETHNYVARTASVTCVVTRSKFSSNVTPAIMKNVSDGIKKGLLGSIGGTATADRKVSYGGRSGRQVDFKSGAGATGAMWVVETPGHVVFTLTIAGQKSLAQADLKRFFGSLKP